MNKQFKKYKIPIEKLKLKDYCYPKKFTLQPQQLYLSDLLSSEYAPWNSNNNRGILVYHQIGAGKTCTAISVAESLKKKYKIIVILPAALIGNFYNELISECTNNEYINNNDRKILNKLKITDNEYTNIIDKAIIKINKIYTILSYHKFIKLILSNKINNLNNHLLIVDEIQNMISINGTFYNSLLNIINKSNNTLKILLLSGTPIFDKPIEIALTLNLIKKNNLFNISSFNQDYINDKYNIIHSNNFKNKIKNLISYYRGAPPVAYPKVIFKTIKCNMSKFQYKSYLTSLSSDDNQIRGSFNNIDLLNISNDFFLGPRMLLNIAFPNKRTGEHGYASLNNNTFKNIKTYSIKFYKIYKKMKQSNGTIFIYSNFKEYGGMKCFISFLEYLGWKNYINYGEGNKRFAIWSGDEKHEIKEEIKFIFNQKLNETGNKIKLILGTPSIKEGVSLLRVQQVHILEPYWNLSRIQQIMGRAVRFCSHKDVSLDKQYVEVYLYISIYPNIKTIDQYIWSIAKRKYKLIEQFELIMKENAFDCELFYNRNYYNSDKIKLSCNK